MTDFPRLIERAFPLKQASLVNSLERNSQAASRNASRNGKRPGYFAIVLDGEG